MRPIAIQPDRDLLPNPVERDVFGDGGVSVLAHCAEASPATGNAGSTRSPSAEQALRLFGSVGLKVGLQQRELDRAARGCPNALVFGSKRGEHLDRREKIPALASRRRWERRYQPYEFERFGVDIKANLEMTEEFCDILDRAFSPDTGPLRLILPARRLADSGNSKATPIV